MKITKFDESNGVTSVIWEERRSIKGVTTYDDDGLFFDIPVSIFDRSRTLESRFSRTFLYSKLRFLLAYDFNLFLKESSVSSISDIGSIEIESGLKDIYNNSQCELMQHEENSIYSYFARERHGLIKRALSRNVETKSKWADNNLKVLGASLVKLFAECQSRCREFYPILQECVDVNMQCSIDIPELIYACHLKPFADLYKWSSGIRPSLNDDRFLKMIAKVLFITKGKCRSNLYTLLYYIGAVPVNPIKSSQRVFNNILLAYTVDKNESEHIYTVVSGNITITFDAESAAMGLGRRNQITDEMVEKLRQIIKKEYDDYKTNSFELDRRIELECSFYNAGVQPSLQEHWLLYQNSLRKEWLDKIHKGSKEDLLKPPLCFYTLVLYNANPEAFFDESFMKDFATVCLNNPGIKINPDLFNAMYHFELIHSRISNTNSPFDAVTQVIATKSMTPEQQNKFSIAKGEIDALLQKIVDGQLINITVFNSPNNFIKLINTIIQDAYFQFKIINNTKSKYKNGYYNYKLLLNILGVLLMSKKRAYFEIGTKGKTIVEKITPDVDVNNYARFITKSSSSDSRYTFLDQTLVTRIERIAEDFVNSI